ncbi:MAG: hypothetical protein D6719_13905, partial [Candidatus Dadabacteria bacterium]
MLVNRKIRVWIYIVLIVLFATVLIGEGLPDYFGSIDLVQYWAGTRLLIAGHNPYDPNLIAELERSVS